MQNDVTDIWKEYKTGLEYQGKIGIRENIPIYVDFYEGKQWPAPTENTKNLPRPVANIIKMICRNKKAALLSVPVRLVYKADNASADAILFTYFAEHIQKEMRQKQLDKNAVSDGVIKGSYFYHYYWDADAVGLGGRLEGALRCELVDPLDIFFANPRELDEQKQKWIIISSRESVETVRAKADKDINLEDIVADDADNNPYRVQEQDDESLCTVLTKYFRKDGRVYCEQATKKVIFKKAWAVIPSAEQRKAELLRLQNGMIDAPNNALPDNAKEQDNIPKTRELYPIVAGCYEKREKCIYGLSEVEGIIPNQKAINFHLAMSLLNAQECAWGKYVAHPNALKGQKISNVPGQVLIDYTGTGNGIRKMTEQSLHGLPLDIVSVITELTRSTTGATEVMSGEALKSGMSGAAIAQLQAQAQQPIEELRESFWLVKEKQGLVLAQFFKHFYYFDKSFAYEELSKETQKKEEKTGIFNSANYEGIDFTVTVEATQGTRSSVVSDISMLDRALTSGAIDLKTYVKAYPDSAIGNKSELIELLEQMENAEITQLKAQNAQLTSQIAEYIKQAEQQKAIVDKIIPTIEENNNLKKDFATLQNEYMEKISVQNEQIRQLTQAFYKTDKEASDFATEILKRQDTDSI